MNDGCSRIKPRKSVKKRNKKNVLPDEDLNSAPPEVAEKTVVLFHDETTFSPMMTSQDYICDQNQREVELWFLTLLVREMDT